MSGAGISVAAGIPDFRSPDTGIYARMEQIVGRKLPTKESIFDLKFFLKQPEVYYAYRKVRFLDPDYLKQPDPTFSHYFIRLLHERNMLYKVLTQNIDGLHNKTGLPEDKVVAAHGTGDKAHCAVCKAPYPNDPFIAALKQGTVIYCSHCSGPIKPQVVFFNEGLPEDFKTNATTAALAKADLLIIVGTSLKVGPFNKIPSRVRPEIP